VALVRVVLAPQPLTVLPQQCGSPGNVDGAATAMMLAGVAVRARCLSANIQHYAREVVYSNMHMLLMYFNHHLWHVANSTIAL
jgi:hypothetical protein